MLAQNLTQSREPVAGMIEPFCHNLSTPFGAMMVAPQTAAQVLWKMTYLQAETLSYANAFFAIMRALFIAAASVPFMNRVKIGDQARPFAALIFVLKSSTLADPPWLLILSAKKS
ncbi:MAG: hypothetical protein POH28_01705 [Acidocella sp.]|nr:hypothetical protein [Acidocella sp.]